MNKKLLEKILDKTAVVGIVGMGYVGLPLVHRFSYKNFKVLGFDIDSQKIEMLNKGKRYIKHISNKKIEFSIKNGFRATAELSEISSVDVIILCLPTPLNDDRSPDLSYVINSFNSFSKYLKKNQLICLESTTYPGTTEEEILPRIEKEGFKVGEDIFLVYSPEREDPSNPIFSTENIPKVVSGYSSQCLEVGTSLYSSIINEIVPVTSLRVGEMSKLLENIYRAINIGLVNEMKIVCDAMDINIHEVIDAASTKPFGFKPFYPGPGLGGHCIPIDPFYLTWKAKKHGVESRFIELAGEVNTNMPDWVISKCEQALASNGLKLKDSKILILGLAYKKNLDDVRESPGIEIFSKLLGVTNFLKYSDPHVTEIPKMRKYNLDESSIDLNKETISSFDLVLLVTDHDDFDYDLISRYSKIIVDTRNRFNANLENVIKA